MGSKTKNVTFSLPGELVDRYKEYVEDNLIASVNSGVREALEEYAKKIDRERLRKEMLKASEDPMFMKDLDEAMAAFEASDTEGTGGRGK